MLKNNNIYATTQFVFVGNTFGAKRLIFMS